MNWIINRLKEKTTWRGITAILTAIGVALEPGQMDAIIVVGVMVGGALEMVFKESKGEKGDKGDKGESR